MIIFRKACPAQQNREDAFTENYCSQLPSTACLLRRNCLSEDHAKESTLI